MDIKLFKVLQIILKSYARQHPQRLIDHNLTIKIILRTPFSSFQHFAKSMEVHPGQIAAFLSKNGSRQVKELVCCVIDHPLGLELADPLIRSIDQCIVMGSKKGVSNVLGKHDEKNDTGSTRAIFFRIDQVQFEELTQHLDSYLSLCEVFFGHLHLVVSCFQASPTVDLMQELKQQEDHDEFSEFRQNGYFRVLEERASRITLEEISQACKIQRHRWGELLVFGNGTEGIILWLTYNRLPILGETPRLKVKGSKEGLQTFWESNIGCKVLVRKEYIRSKLEDLETTVIIVNLKEQYSRQIQSWIEPLFQAQIKKMMIRGALLREEGALRDKMAMCERTAQLLAIPTAALLKKLI